MIEAHFPGDSIGVVQPAGIIHEVLERMPLATKGIAPTVAMVEDLRGAHRHRPW